MADYENIVNPDFRNGKEMIFSIQHGGNANSTSQLYQTRMIYLFGPPAMSLANGTSIQFHLLKDLVIFQVRKDVFANTAEYLPEVVVDSRQDALLLIIIRTASKNWYGIWLRCTRRI